MGSCENGRLVAEGGRSFPGDEGRGSTQLEQGQILCFVEKHRSLSKAGSRAVSVTSECSFFILPHFNHACNCPDGGPCPTLI